MMTELYVLVVQGLWACKMISLSVSQPWYMVIHRSHSSMRSVKQRRCQRFKRGMHGRRSRLRLQLTCSWWCSESGWMRVFGNWLTAAGAGADRAWYALMWCTDRSTLCSWNLPYVCLMANLLLMHISYLLIRTCILYISKTRHCLHTSPLVWHKSSLLSPSTSTWL